MKIVLDYNQATGVVATRYGEELLVWRHLEDHVLIKPPLVYKSPMGDTTIESGKPTQEERPFKKGFGEQAAIDLLNKLNNKLTPDNVAAMRKDWRDDEQKKATSGKAIQQRTNKADKEEEALIKKTTDEYKSAVDACGKEVLSHQERYYKMLTDEKNKKKIEENNAELIRVAREKRRTVSLIAHNDRMREEKEQIERTVQNKRNSFIDNLMNKKPRFWWPW